MNTNTIIKILKSHSKETGMKPFTTQIQYKPFSEQEYYEYTSSSVLIRFNLTARNSPTSKVAGCKGFGLVQGLAPCA